MFDFIVEAPSLLKGFWWVAILSSAIFLIQSILTLLGTDATDGLSADFDGHLDAIDEPFQLFSFRNLINFLLGFSWGGIALFPLFDNQTVIVLLATVIGAIFVLLYLVIIQQILKLAEDNTFDIRQLVNKTGSVYLTIPANRTGMGKINISHKGTTHELNAFTNGEAIKTGETIKVNQIENSILIVEKI